MNTRKLSLHNENYWTSYRSWGVTPNDPLGQLYWPLRTGAGLPDWFRRTPWVRPRTEMLRVTSPIQHYPWR